MATWNDVLYRFLLLCVPHLKVSSTSHQHLINMVLTKICITKTPGRWRPSRIVPSLSVFLLKDVKWWQEDKKIRNDKVNLYRSTRLKFWKPRFSTWRPWPFTLTIELIQDVIKLNPYTKFLVPSSNGSAVRALVGWLPDWRGRFYTLDC